MLNWISPHCNLHMIGLQRKGVGEEKCNDHAKKEANFSKGDNEDDGDDKDDDADELFLPKVAEK